MDLATYIFLSFIEILFLLLSYNIIFEKNNIINFIPFCSISFAGAIYLQIFNELSPSILYCSCILFISIFVCINNKKDYLTTLIEITIPSILLIINEVCVIILMSLLSFIKNKTFTFLFSILFTFVFLLIILSLIFKRKYVSLTDTVKNHKVINIILINILLVALILKVLIDKSIIIHSVFIELTTLFIIFIAINLYFYYYLFTEFKKKAQLEIERELNPLLEDFIDKLRASEHEFKNHLNTLYSVVQVSTESEIKNYVSNYIDNFKETDVLKKLLYIDNTTLKAILYNTLSQAESLNLNICFTIESSLKSLPLDSTEIVILISNLINNASEAALESEEKLVEIIIKETNNSIISVRNSVKNNLNININSIFNKGYSTKGTKRGYGLYNIKSIIKKYDGNILVSLNDNMFEISIEI